jgi:hypothetical protein
VKCYIRRAQAKEKLDKLDEAFLDYKKGVELGVASAKSDVARLEPIVKVKCCMILYLYLD